MDFPRKMLVSNILGYIPEIISFYDIFQVLHGEFKLRKLVKIYT